MTPAHLVFVILIRAKYNMIKRRSEFIRWRDQLALWLTKQEKDPTWMKKIQQKQRSIFGASCSPAYEKDE